MSREREDRLDPSQPTLIIQSGNTRRKHRPLDRPVLVLGRASGCDLGLESPDVAPVHCVIAQAADGWHVRDCTGKGGTRVNGGSVYDAVLNDEDVLQVGSFSFLLHLPPEHRPDGGATAVPDNPDLRHARRSRHNLARHALRLRTRVAEMQAAAGTRDEGELTARWEELDRRSAELDALQADVDGRLAELKRGAQDAGARKAEVEERRQALDAATAAAARAQAIRAEEQRRYAAHLRGLRKRLAGHEESLTARWEEWLREQQEASVAVERQREQLQREEALLRDQRAEVVRLMTEMRQVRKLPEGLVESLREEVEQLRRGLAERESAAADARAEADGLRARLAERRDEPAAPDAGLERFRVELDTGRRLLDEQIRDIQSRFAQLERAARDAEEHIASERERMARERQELERLRGGLWHAGGPCPGGETLVDAPSPLHHLLNNVQPAEA